MLTNSGDLRQKIKKLKMSTMNKMYLLLVSFLFTGLVYGQELENEIGFIYVKAEYLLDTDRYEDAIAEYNKVIDIDPAYKDALYKRASAKFAIAAFLGTKRDLLKAFEVKGITPELITLFGKAQKNLDETEAASNTLKTASMLKGGSSSSGMESKKIPQTKKESPKVETSENEENPQEETSNSTEDMIKEGAKEMEDKITGILDDILGRNEEEQNDESGTQNTEEPEEEKEEVYVPDNSVKEIFIDEDLTIMIQDGLGNRKILNQPNILILSETSGIVAVDVCVNRNGKVDSAEYNKSNSSLATQSLVSLAVRKSKEFWFESNDRDQVCGSILFKITGRS